LWRNHLRIGLCPDRLILAGYRRGLRRRISRREVVAIAPTPDPVRWQAAVDALRSALAPSSPGKPEVTVVLSNHFVRYALLPWNETLKTEEEWMAYARHRLTEAHGHLAEEWIVQVTETAPRGPRIAAAVDKALLDALEAKISESGSALVSVQPYLMVAFNRLQSVIGNEWYWLVIEEPGRLTLALIERGIWRAIRSRRVDEHWRRTLPEILEREDAVLGLERPCTQIVACTHEAIDTNVHKDYIVRDLTLAAGVRASDRNLAMALG